ncbi:MAG: hypothetical protein A2068_12055 [Ignavibacteria bacterium GWB2_35_6b]|nr:MAG: hypothetical protein A2068_12055 [Ignavibacteria bacterium GWB2_35_6b]
MGMHYTKKSEQEKRRHLRTNMTSTEKIVWTHLRKKQLGCRFLRQYSVDHFVIDFYSPELKLAIEIDGDVHKVPENKEYDKARQKYIEGFGIKFVRIKNEEIFGNADLAFEKIIKEIDKLKKS